MYSLRWRTAKRPELQKRRGGEKEKEASELANSPSSAKSESCGESQALGALSPLFCILVPPCPSPVPLSSPRCCDFFFSPLPCTSFLHVALSSSLSPSFRSSLSQPCSLWLFYPSPSLSVRLPATIFTFLLLCPVARWYFCCLWLSLSGSVSLLFKVFLLGSVAHHESISFSISLYPAPCPSF